MAKIQILSDELTSKIAAGEVVERPASIVKELIENSLDAGATELTIELEKGGCKSIRVMDNGEGISRDDVARAFERFATSKIYRFEDIYEVQSFGFRGEALPSIAAVSRVEIVTRHREASFGTKAIIGGGAETAISEIGCPVGTSILVSDIFENVPVRKKFLKTESTEQTACLDVITRITLAHPDVHVRVRINGRPHLDVPATKNTVERLSLVMGEEFTGNFIPVRGVSDSMELSGFVSRQDFTRASSKYLYCFVNRRFIRDPLINHAIRTAYRNIIEPKRHPSAVLFLQMPLHDVDVNVHPAKLEVRFRESQYVYGLVLESIASALAGTGELVEKEPTVHTARVQETMKRYVLNAPKVKGDFGDRFSRKHISPSLPITNIPPAAEKLLFSEFEYLGRIAGVYLVFGSGRGILLLDQHAAHERILFERFKDKELRSRGNSQQLLLSETLSLTPKDYAIVSEHLDQFNQAGLVVEPFGGSTMAIKAIPVELSHLDPKAFLRDLIEEAQVEDRFMIQKENPQYRIFAAMACKGAIKANDLLTKEEVAALCRDLDAIPNFATCPHGRPTYHFFSVRELEKMFRRT